MRSFRVAKAKHGKGLFATRTIEPGEPILPFTGPKINYQEVLRMKNPDNALAISKRKYLDLTKPCVYANHSCEPNAGIKGKNLVLTAIKRIETGEEITWDYSTSLDWTACEFVCDCGAKTCRKEITDFIELPKKKQKTYLRLGIVLPFIAREAQKLS